MTGKERAEWRAKANHLEPLFQLGKGGISDAFIDAVNGALNTRELIKFKVLLETSPMTPREAADEVAAQNRLTVTVRVTFTNRKHPEDSFESESFSAYADYDSTNSLDAVESTLCIEIIDKIVEDIFNATVAQW